MSIYYHFWKIWLWISESKERASINIPAEIANKSIIKSNKDIAEKLITDGVEVSYSTLTYIINQYDRIVREMICEGYTVETNNVKFTPRLIGEWDIKHIEFIPNIHKRFIDCTLSAEIKRSIESIGIEIQGLKDPSYFITQITDKKSGEINSVISRNGEIIIEGKGIMAIGKDDTSKNCILLANKNNELFDISEDISINEPEKVVLTVTQSLEKGKYRLLIHTYFSTNKNDRLPYHRCIEFDKTIIVK